MSEEERKSRIDTIRRELKREEEYSRLLREYERIAAELGQLLSMVHPRPEKTGW